MEEGLHDKILIGIIAVIILLQFYVFLRNYRKIQGYKRTIESTKDFEIVEVSVPEDWVQGIEVEEILKDPEAFQELATAYSRPEEMDQDLERVPTGEKVNLDYVQEHLRKVKYSEEIEDDPRHQQNTPEEYEHAEHPIEEEYDGPFKSFRNKLKNFLE